jgi:hypothetical protein
MAYVEPVDPVADEATKVTLAESQNAAIINHETRLQVMEGNDLLNGSFEVSDSGDPDGITITVDGSASRALNTTEAHVGHGKVSEAATMTVASGDAVQYTWDDYTPVAPGQRVHFAGVIKNASGIKVTVKILWYYWTGSAYSAATDADTTVYSASETLASFAKIHGSAVSPRGDAHDGLFWRLFIEVGGTGEVTAGTVYLDGMECGAADRLAVIGRTSVWAAADGTGTVSCATALGDEFPNAAVLQFSAGAGSGTESVTVQGWDGSAWQTVVVIGIDSTFGASTTFTVPLNASREFNISAETIASGNIYLIGTM